MNDVSITIQRIRRAQKDRRLWLARWSLFKRRNKDTHVLEITDKEWVFLCFGDIRSRDFLHIDDLQNIAMRRALFFKHPEDCRLQEFTDLKWLGWKYREDLSELGANVCFEQVSIGRAYRVKLYTTLPPEDKVGQVWDGSFDERISQV